MTKKERRYIAIDLKSFYASVECADRGLNPLTTNLVVADESRTEKTICLAVSPSLKAIGVSGRARLFEVVQTVGQENARRKEKLGGRDFEARSCDANILGFSPETEVDYIVAKPRMARYMEVSTQIYQIYLKYVAPEDMHIYSVDEVFIDATAYLNTYRMTAHELAMTMIREVLRTTGITATAGIGTNLYLCKIAMDITAKHMEPDADGVRIAELDERTYRELLWDHRPITDFWRVGRGYAKKLAQVGLYTMGDVAKCSVGAPHDFYNEDLLYKMFGINAELLIDHAWGVEPCRISDIKGYEPETRSISSGQVLQNPYSCEKARVVIREMADALSLELVDKGFVTDQIVLTIGYDVENLSDAGRKSRYSGEVKKDRYGRSVPKHAHGTQNLERATASTALLLEAVTELYDRIIDPALLIRRMTISANHLQDEKKAGEPEGQIDLFSYYGAWDEEQQKKEEALARERQMQQAMIDIRKRYGKNAVLKGMNFREGATAQERNQQIGGHKA